MVVLHPNPVPEVHCNAEDVVEHDGTAMAVGEDEEADALATTVLAAWLLKTVKGCVPDGIVTVPVNVGDAMGA